MRAIRETMIFSHKKYSATLQQVRAYYLFNPIGNTRRHWVRLTRRASKQLILVEYPTYRIRVKRKPLNRDAKSLIISNESSRLRRFLSTALNIFVETTLDSKSVSNLFFVDFYKKYFGVKICHIRALIQISASQKKKI